MFSQTTMTLYQRPIEDVASLDIGSAKGLLCRELTRRDRSALGRLLAAQEMRETLFQPVFGMEDVDERLRMGERCFICEDRGRIAGYIWFRTLEAYIAEIDAMLRLEQDDVYGYNAYVDQEYRGRNIAPLILVTASGTLLAGGFRRFLLVTMSWNKNMQRVLNKVKFLRGGDLRAGYLATFRFTINHWGNVSVSNCGGPFTFYGKLFRKAAAALLRGATAARGRMV